jgi:hypothetical protein
LCFYLCVPTLVTLMGNREDRVDQGTLDGQDPTQEVGPEECEAKPADAQLPAGAFEEPPDASHPQFSEEIQDAYQPEPDFMVPHPADGLPSPADERDSDNLATAPAFTYENVICVGDDREWVELFESEIDFLKTIPPAEDLESGAAAGVLGPMPTVDPNHMQRWWRILVSPEGQEFRLAINTIDVRQLYRNDGTPRGRRTFKPEDVVQRFGRSVAFSDKFVADPDMRPGDVARPSMVFVRPVREPCKHYMRQVFSNDSIPDPNEPGHKLVFRNCAARRSVGGAFLSLRDEGVFACDYRDPPHLESVKRHLDEPDKVKLGGDDHLTRLPLFKDVRGFARPDQPVQGPPMPPEPKKE